MYQKAAEILESFFAVEEDDDVSNVTKQVGEFSFDDDSK